MKQAFLNKLAPAFALGLLAVVSLAGCGGKSGVASTSPASTAVPLQTGASNQPPATVTATSPTGAASASTTGKASAQPAKVPDACSFVTKTEIATAYGAMASDGKRSTDNQCDFEISGTSLAGKIGLFNEVSVTIDTREPDDAYDQVKLVFPKAVKVAIGEEAYSIDLIVYQLHVLKGGYTMVIAGPLLADDSMSRQIVNELGKTLAARL